MEFILQKTTSNPAFSKPKSRNPDPEKNENMAGPFVDIFNLFVKSFYLVVLIVIQSTLHENYIYFKSLFPFLKMYFLLKKTRINIHLTSNVLL